MGGPSCQQLCPDENQMLPRKLLMSGRALTALSRHQNQKTSNFKELSPRHDVTSPAMNLGHPSVGKEARPSVGPSFTPDLP